MVKGAGAEIAVDPDFRDHGSLRGSIIHDRAEENEHDIQGDIPREGIHGPPGDEMVQSIALQQGQRKIDPGAGQAADQHDPERFPVFPDVGEELRNAEKGQGSPLFLCFHQTASSSLLRLWIRSISRNRPG